MSRDITPDLHKIQLYLTEAHPCSYLEDKQATTAFVDPKHPLDTATYSHLSTMGFRRSGQYIYAPRCASCKSCIPVRVPVSGFKPTRSQKRCLKRNLDISANIEANIDPDEHYALYQKYIDTRHSDGDMYPATLTQYRDFIGKPWECTRFIEFRLDGKLIACAVSDWLDDGLSAIYTYYDPDLSARSLGTLAILRQIQMAQEQEFDYLYLGYWIRDSVKMAYKSKFRPAELYIENRWLRI
ncbi:MAG: arginyltransferase [Cellvibrionales bacterium]|nr:MAG: arginyltransferase [Cellvibrionales bacterium]